MKKRNKITGQTGLAPLKSLDFYPGKFGIYSYLFLVDREHFKKEPKEEIEEYIKNTVKIGLEKIEWTNTNNDALEVFCKVGSAVINIYTCIFGQKKCIAAHSKISLPANSLKNDFVDFHGFLI
ncbi:MAG: hypothetical protein CVT89_03340 [Candidatus Altiarchaeales archaeon HGW-Altiarchaeales-2]|nr:MAG: hypothetical protein CVT89_03340 [Candidatus Altiarchaeales archaeon HGW-Altiarchaeales-2]